MAEPDPTACANGSGRRLTDEIPQGNVAFAAFMPCDYCGHPGCFPGQRCIHCTVEIRLRNLEQQAART